MKCRSCGEESIVKRTKKSARQDIRERACPACGDEWETVEKETPKTRLRRTASPGPSGRHTAAISSSPVAARQHPQLGPMPLRSGSPSGSDPEVIEITEELRSEKPDPISDPFQDHAARESAIPGAAGGPEVYRLLSRLWGSTKESEFGGFAFEARYGFGQTGKFQTIVDILVLNPKAQPFLERSLREFWRSVKTGTHPAAEACAKRASFALGAWWDGFEGDVARYLGVAPAAPAGPTQRRASITQEGGDAWMAKKTAELAAAAAARR